MSNDMKDAYLDWIRDCGQVTVRGAFEAGAQWQSQQANGKPVGWQFYSNGEWRDGSSVYQSQDEMEGAGVPVRSVYAAPPDPKAVPKGWKLVPIEPTVSMLKAASQEENECAVHNYGGHPESSDYWSVMLSAAPSPEDPK